MLRLSANLSTMFAELPFLERFAAARRAGFAAVEAQYPYDHAVADVAAARREAGIPLVLLNAPKGTREGDRGLACLPGRQDEFREAVETALDCSAALGNRLVHVLSGVPDAECDRESCAAVWRANMAWAADRAAQAGVGIVVEALNPGDVPGYFIRSLDDAVALLRALGKDNAGLLFDVYHCARAGEPVVAQFRACMPWIRHVQIADAPSRAEPGTGDIDWSGVFAAVERSGYQGFVGAEYTPRAGTLAGLAWARPYLVKPS
ncbi:MAG: TIM barrel protein [Aquamicrobium sp.]|nr:TIM barrel protein [Aquamicrobium sp.]